MRAEIEYVYACSIFRSSVHSLIPYLMPSCLCDCFYFSTLATLTLHHNNMTVGNEASEFICSSQGGEKLESLAAIARPKRDVHPADNIDPREPSNMKPLLALE